MTKILELPDDGATSWKSTTRCTNAACRALIELTASDLRLADHGSYDLAAEPVTSWDPCVICPNCQDLIWVSRGSVPVSVLLEAKKIERNRR